MSVGGGGHILTVITLKGVLLGRAMALGKIGAGASYYFVFPVLFLFFLNLSGKLPSTD